VLLRNCIHTKDKMMMMMMMILGKLKCKLCEEFAYTQNTQKMMVFVV